MMVVAFGRNESPDIYVINADGSGLKRLTDHPAVDVLTSWSPDGTQVAFYSNRDGDDIYVVNVDGTELIRLTHHPATDISPRWSPDSNRIAFTSTRDGPAGDLPGKRRWHRPHPPHGPSCRGCVHFLVPGWQSDSVSF